MRLFYNIADGLTFSGGDKEAPSLSAVSIRFSVRLRPVKFKQERTRDCVNLEVEHDLIRKFFEHYLEILC